MDTYVYPNTPIFISLHILLIGVGRRPGWGWRKARSITVLGLGYFSLASWQLVLPWGMYWKEVREEEKVSTVDFDFDFLNICVYDPFKKFN